jgi:prepilin-type N-terminal cleavage/methylation domain-containing protein
MPPRRRSGFTLVEILVVLILMALATALVAPALLPPRRERSALGALLGSARETAARRGEVVYLHIAPTGEWRIEGGANPLEGTLATGRVQSFASAPVTLVVSPLGSCAFDVRSGAAAAVVELEPLTCEARVP